MSRLAIMQPYLFPYIGYFQLVAAVDRFLFLDDCNFIKQGWINRNRLEISGRVTYFTVPLSGASSNRRISEIAVAGSGIWRQKLLRTISQSYSGAPYLRAVLGLVEEVICQPGGQIADIARASVELTARMIGLSPRFGLTSEEHAGVLGAGIDRVLDICVAEGARAYVNLPGGRQMYSPDRFLERGLSLEFIEPNLAPYPRGGRPFIGSLSILDVLLFNGPAAAAALVRRGVRK
jgi:hypothetical protein